MVVGWEKSFYKEKFNIENDQSSVLLNPGTNNMQINLYSSLRNIAGRSTIIYPGDETFSLLDVLNRIAQEFPAFQAIFFDQQGNLYDQMPVFLNGRNPRLLPEKLKTKVSATDVLSLFTPIASGKINVEVLKKEENEERKQEPGDEN